jgi:hypothetical protein
LGGNRIWSSEFIWERSSGKSKFAKINSAPKPQGRLGKSNSETLSYLVENQKYL